MNIICVASQGVKRILELPEHTEVKTGDKLTWMQGNQKILATALSENIKLEKHYVKELIKATDLPRTVLKAATMFVECPLVYDEIKPEPDETKPEPKFKIGEKYKFKNDAPDVSGIIEITQVTPMFVCYKHITGTSTVPHVFTYNSAYAVMFLEPYPETKPSFKIGDRFQFTEYATNATGIIEVIAIKDSFVLYKHLTGESEIPHMFTTDSKYSKVFLKPYEEPEKKFYTGIIKCIANTGSYPFTVGYNYHVYDGILQNDCGLKRQIQVATFEEFIKELPDTLKFIRVEE